MIPLQKYSTLNNNSNIYTPVVTIQNKKTSRNPRSNKYKKSLKKYSSAKTQSHRSSLLKPKSLKPKSLKPKSLKPKSHKIYKIYKNSKSIGYLKHKKSSKKTL